MDDHIEPLSDAEMIVFENKYTSMHQTISTMSVKSAVDLFKVVTQDVPTNKYEVYYHNLFIRRLHMIIDWTNYPERLI